MSRKSFTLLVRDTASLPTVLTAIALRVPGYTLTNDRAGQSGGWLIRIEDLPQDMTTSLMDVLPPSYFSVHQTD